MGCYYKAFYVDGLLRQHCSKTSANKVTKGFIFRDQFPYMLISILYRASQAAQC